LLPFSGDKPNAPQLLLEVFDVPHVGLLFHQTHT